MAMCWIQGIVNHHSTHVLRVRCLDQDRHPTIKGKKYGANDWFELPAGKRVETSEIDNLGVPWNNEKAQRLIFEWGPAVGPKEALQLDITGHEAWDWIRLRDSRDDVLGEFEVGSLGNAPGINHSGWTIHLEESGQVRLKNEFRQGLKRDDLLRAVNAVGSVISSIDPDKILKAVKQAQDIVVEVRKTVKQVTGIVDDVVTGAPKEIVSVMKDAVGVATGLGVLPTPEAKVSSTTE